MIQGSGAGSVGGLVRAGETVFGAVSHLGVVAVLTVYFLADLRRIRAMMYRFVPNSRRPRAILIGDEVMAKVGDYVFGNVLTSLIAGAATFGWCFIFNVPYALLRLWPSWTSSRTAQPSADSWSLLSRWPSRFR
jgi:predicted PurR-regulated permease PerM